MSAAFNGWSFGGTVHAPAMHNRLVPLCVEGAARTQGQRPPNPDSRDLDWHITIPEGDAICDDEVLPQDCPDCIAWQHA